MRRWTSNVATLALMVSTAWAVVIIAGAAVAQFSKEHTEMREATGTFKVEMTPLGEPQAIDGLTLGRFLNEKRFAGDLMATSRGEMLTAMTDTENSAGYVLIEHVTGTLGGRRGSFALQHSSTVDRGTQRQSIVVVPDSGKGDLSGLTGEMTVQVSPGKHAYTLRYNLPE